MAEPERDMVRRAARAVRNLQAQIGEGAEWASWVPEYLDRLVDRAAAEASPNQRPTPSVEPSPTAAQGTPDAG